MEHIDQRDVEMIEADGAQHSGEDHHARQSLLNPDGNFRDVELNSSTRHAGARANDDLLVRHVPAAHEGSVLE